MTRWHWREYGIEAAALGAFMISALTITALIEHPASPLRHAIASALVRRALIGLGMGLTSASITYSPWGRRSGAHLNPSVTLTFLRLGKMAPRDAVGYFAAQFAGGLAAIVLAATAFHGVLGDPAVDYVATRPGAAGVPAAFAAETAISFGLMWIVLTASNRPGLARWTGGLAAGAVALYITIEAPLSGMSMNPARSFAPALAAGAVGPLWIYFTAPPLGMLLAAEHYVRRHGGAAVRCAKLAHPAGGPCHFQCHWRAAGEGDAAGVRV